MTDRQAVRAPRDPFVDEWISVLRDPETRQAIGAYTDPYDVGSHCAWGHNPHQNKIARRYGQGFRLSVEELNDRHHLSLPEIADYVERELER
jgi:hypothetical protein